MFDNAVGRTTVAKDADGTERTVYWREYPGVAGIDPRQVWEGPTPQQGHDAEQTVVAEIKAALSEQFQLEWAPVGDTAGSSPFHRPIENHYGGDSLLTKYGYEAPTIDGLENWSAEDRIRELGGPTPDKQVIVSGVALGRAGQWLSLCCYRVKFRYGFVAVAGRSRS